MAERVDKFGRCVVFQGSLVDCTRMKYRMGQISDLVVGVIDLAVYLTQQAATAAVQWIEALVESSDILRRIVCSVVADAKDYSRPIDLDGVPGPTSCLHSLFLCYSHLWHHPRRAVRALLMALMREQDFKAVFARCFVKVIDTK